MSIKDEVAAERDPRLGQCIVCRWVEDQDEADEWREVMLDKSFSHRQVWRTMVNHGYAGADQSVQRCRVRRHNGTS